MINSTDRFSSRVENYVKYRPGYPKAIIDLLREKCQLTTASIIADIGSGTGILTELLLKNQNAVFGVEPNQEMREAAERLLIGYPQFHSISATAEVTTLPAKSMDLITVGQAFHWFDCGKTRREFLRVLKPHGWVALIWNDRNITGHPFFGAYEQLLQTFATDYAAVGHKHTDADLVRSFFGAGGFKLATFPNEQVFDFEGLQGRLLSSSYAPEPGNPKHIPMLKELRTIFEQNEANGKVAFKYDTVVYYGQLTC